jgi:6-phosphogluconolactonase (cycloisomerase 2 family)
MAVVLGMSACGGYTIGFMWVLGTQYNQIAGLKIDDFTGNLTDMVNSPYSSGGTDPVSIAVRVGGNFVFVVNKGTVNASGASNRDGNVSVFAVGEDGILTFQNSYSTSGQTPIWAAGDGTGSFLYVLDSQAPDYNNDPTKGAINLDGDITVFGVDGNTGRLQVIPNQLIKNSAGQQVNYFEVGKVPTTFRTGGSCLYTLDSKDQSIYSYGIGSGGQLTLEVNSTIPLGTVNATSLNVSGNSIYVTDAGSALSTGGSIIPYTPGSGCSLSVQADGPVANLPTTSNPVYSMTDARGMYLYVLNQNSTNTSSPTLPNSTISAFVIESTGQLQPVSDPNNPYPIGSGPVCMVEDPSSQYVYTSNGNDGTVSGKYINPNTGQLSNLTRGSSFPVFAAQASCLVVSGSVD